jgi:hypothetical protein
MKDKTSDEARLSKAAIDAERVKTNVKTKTRPQTAPQRAATTTTKRKAPKRKRNRRAAPTMHGIPVPPGLVAAGEIAKIVEASKKHGGVSEAMQALTSALVAFTHANDIEIDTAFMAVLYDLEDQLAGGDRDEDDEALADHMRGLRGQAAVRPGVSAALSKALFRLAHERADEHGNVGLGATGLVNALGAYVAGHDFDPLLAVEHLISAYRSFRGAKHPHERDDIPDAAVDTDPRWN